MSYPSDTRDKQWEVLELAMPKGKRAGRPRKHDARKMMDAILVVAQCEVLRDKLS